MSDFLSELRGDLVDAHERYGRRGRTGRLARPVHPRTWRPAAMLATVAAAACLIAGVLGVRALRGPAPTSVQVVDQIRVGGQPVDAALGFGSLWVGDFGGSVIQVDPARHTILRRIPVGGSVDSVAADVGAVWVTTSGDESHNGRLVRIDPRSGRVTAHFPMATYSAIVAADRGAVWLLSTHSDDLWLKRIDPATGRTLATLTTSTIGDAIALAGDSLWTLTAQGVLMQRDPDSGRALRRLAGLGSSPNQGEHVLAADASGVWVLRSGTLVRIPGGGVVRRTPLRSATLPVFAHAGRALWIASTSGFPPRYGLLRVADDTGALTGRLDLGSHQPQALVPSPRGLWVVAADGTVLLVR